MTVSGTDFRYGTTICQFGEVASVQASYISQTSVVCVSPAGAGGSVPVEVTTDNTGSADTFSTDGLMFTYQGEAPMHEMMQIARPLAHVSACITDLHCEHHEGRW